jgi:CheY-like chemotaxis protein
MKAVLPRRGKILVMDDEEGVREIIGVLLERMGHEVTLVEDGGRTVEAYKKARDQKRPFDLVILDLTVRAGIGGEEAMQALIKVDPPVKAIVMSGYADDPVLQEPERYGFMGILTKPFDSDSLRKALVCVMGPENTHHGSRITHQASPMAHAR